MSESPASGGSEAVSSDADGDATLSGPSSSPTSGRRDVRGGDREIDERAAELGTPSRSSSWAECDEEDRREAPLGERSCWTMERLSDDRQQRQQLQDHPHTATMALLNEDRQQRLDRQQWHHL